MNDLDNTTGLVPHPDEEWEQLFDGINIFTQWVFGEWVAAQLDNMQKAPINPSTNDYYRYSRTTDGKKYQIATEMEDGSEATALIDSVAAWVRVNRIRWNFTPGIYMFDGETEWSKVVIYLPSIVAAVSTGWEIGTTQPFVLDGEGGNLIDTLESIVTYEELLEEVTEPLAVLWSGDVSEVGSSSFVQEVQSNLSGMIVVEVTEKSVWGMLSVGGIEVATLSEESLEPSKSWNDAYTTLLIQPNDIADSTIFTDATWRHTITSYLGLKHYIDKAKFWNSSIYFDLLSKQKLAITDNQGDFSFGANNFTVDTWMFIENTASFPYLPYLFNAWYGTSNNWSLDYVDNYIRIMITRDIWTNINFSGYGVAKWEWIHIALTRESDLLKIYINWILKGSTAFSGDMPIVTNLYIWENGNMNRQGIYYDEMRISKGIARTLDSNDQMYIDPTTTCVSAWDQCFSVPTETYGN